MRKGEPLDPAATRVKVLRTAGRLFRERGTHTVGVNEIAEAAGVSKLTLYRHFDSKEGLIQAFLESASDLMMRRFERTATELGLSPEERILMVMDDERRRSPGRYDGCPLVNTAVEWRGSESSPGTIARVHLDRIQALLERLCDEAGFADPAAVASQLLLLLEGAIVVRLVGDREDSERVARDAASALLASAPRVSRGAA
ncbi:MAG TPA: TetR/AcrR family transcriptional regulator [Thermoleophilaceae bacterium]